MKKIIILIAISCVISGAKAQRFDGGVLLGFSVNQIDGDDLAGFDKGGLVAGFFAETKLSKQFDLMGEVHYYGKGAAKNSEDNTTYGKRKLHYIEVPISVNYKVQKKLGAHLGLAPSYFFKGSQEGNIYDTGEIDFYKKADLGWLAGVTFGLSNSLSLRLRYTYSLFSISKGGPSGNHYGWIARTINLTNGDYNNSLQATFLYTIK